MAFVRHDRPALRVAFSVPLRVYPIFCGQVDTRNQIVRHLLINRVPLIVPKRLIKRSPADRIQRLKKRHGMFQGHRLRCDGYFLFFHCVSRDASPRPALIKNFKNFTNTPNPPQPTHATLFGQPISRIHRPLNSARSVFPSSRRQFLRLGSLE